MTWSTAQRAMLRELGVPAFWPEVSPDEAAAPAAAPPDSVAAPAPAAAAAAAAVQSDDEALAAAMARPDAAVRAERNAERNAGLRPVAGSLPSAAPTGSAQAELGQRPSGIDTMDWPALRTAVAGCEACGLCKGRTQAVFGVGHPQAHWMIVGDPPVEQEDKQGEPFVDKPGQLLDRMLAAVGLRRDEAPAAEQVFIANVLKCRPPANRIPLPQELAQCEPYLLRQVQLVQPKLILAMGRFAVQSLLKSSEPIGKLRGRVHDYHGVPLVVTYHPAALLRSLAHKALAWDDLCRAREVLHTQPPAQLPR